MAPTPSRRMSGWAQWWPARTQTPWRPRISATSCGWTPSSAKETSAPRWAGSRGPWRVQARHRAQALERVADELALVRRGRAPCRCPAGSRPRRPRPIASAMFAVPASNFAGLSAQRVSSTETEAIMCPPVMNGGIASSSSGAAVQDADAGRPVGLVPGPGVEVGVDRAEVDRQLRHGLRAVDDDDRAGGVRAADDLVDRVDRPERRWRRARRRRPSRRRRASSASSSSRSQHARRRRRRRPRASAPRARASSCHGTKFEWCSISVTTTRSPGPTLASPQE